MSSSCADVATASMTDGVPYQLVPFDSGTADLSAELALLHGALLPHSPVALLGTDFLQRFYYRSLPRMGLVFGQIAFVGGRPAGFVAATHDSSGFMRTAIRRRFLQIACVMALAVLRRPRRVGAIWEGLQILRGLPPLEQDSPQAELLSMGVLPEYRAREFVSRTRLRIGQDLLAGVLGQLEKRDFGRVRVIVDADNIEARLFYSGQGWTPGLSRVPGWRKETVEFVWRRPDPETAAKAGISKGARDGCG